LIKESIDKEDIEIITKTKDLREGTSYDVSASFCADQSPKSLKIIPYPLYRI